MFVWVIPAITIPSTLSGVQGSLSPTNVPVQQIQHHGSWTLDCVWRYKEQDKKIAEAIANTFAKVLHNA